MAHKNGVACLSVVQCVAAVHSIPDSNPTDACICVQVSKRNGSTTTLAVRRAAGVTSEVNLRNPLRTGNEAHK